MSLVDEYRRQFAWRSWEVLLDALPPLPARTVADLGCGEGSLSAALAARGARVIGVDGNRELLDAARARGIEGAEFVQGDLRTLPDLGRPVDGIWSSFAAAYLLDLTEVLEAWSSWLRPGGWIVMTEVDDLFGHEPLGARTRELLESYVRESLAAGRYDFRMGRRLEEHLERAGFTRRRSLELPDRELSFAGPADPDVVEAWRRRFERMTLLRAHCGVDFEPVRDEFLRCLCHAEHRSRARVVACIASR